ncbi:hypothetical protein F5B22DRAFT_612070 [Xylaria bambusicola]|uniref:uncharacterized protein n=1 Tax=Xylaria bambusicola TaxID=326684 RepID=UPI002007AF2C|nr:uncharacterized protein F5B22DRAFT_612070 [Xylaria bambusicola]KAI0513316.1 hypothetical protein F5B22DRAFT_612070 [Xylaria bambusicola]
MIMDYADRYNLRVALIVQDKTNGDYKIFQKELDENFPPVRDSIKPCILHVGHEAEAPTNTGEAKLGNDLQLKLRKIEWEILQSEVPKAPKFQRPIFIRQPTAGPRTDQVSKERPNKGLGSDKEADHSREGLGHVTTHRAHDAKTSKPSENKKHA